MLQRCYIDVTLVLHWCYRGIKGVLQGYYRGVKWDLKECTMDVKKCYRGVTKVLLLVQHLKFKFKGVCHGCHRVVTYGILLV